MKLHYFVALVFLILACQDQVKNKTLDRTKEPINYPVTAASLVILGTIQDAGSPHIACNKDCCSMLFNNPDPLRKVVSLGVIDHQNSKSYLFEATPDITTQLKKLSGLTKIEDQLPHGIFVTHAHIGHYSGLMYLGKEATNADRVQVFAMPRMKNFLKQNGPWSQLVTNNNISIQELSNKEEITLTSNLKVTPFSVPHRDEFSETVGFIIEGPSNKALFIPDIDKWEKWETSITEAISSVDYAFLDATFYSGAEINNRDISEIPHPFIIESMELFKDLPISEKQKVHFIHFNHTNPVINSDSEMYQTVVEAGYNVTQIYDVFGL